jgi:hypothetical protein
VLYGVLLKTIPQVAAPLVQGCFELHPFSIGIGNSDEIAPCCSGRHIRTFE